MTKQEIEDEIQARVNFKLAQLLEGVKNTAKASWAVAFHGNRQRETHYWEAFNQLKGMIRKEMAMSSPFDNMAERRNKQRVNEAITKISEKLSPRETREHKYHLRFLTGIINDLMFKK